MTQREIYHVLKSMRGQKLTVKQISKFIVQPPTGGKISHQCGQLVKFRMVKVQIENRGKNKIPIYWV